VHFIRLLGWTMRKKGLNDRTAGGLLLLLLLLAIHLLKGFFNLPEPNLSPCMDKVFVEILGNVLHPGVYGFPQPPFFEQVLTRAGGSFPTSRAVLPPRVTYRSGARVEVFSNEKDIYLFESETSAFYKITLGIPISINRESLEGLTAVPGIGPAIASEIIHERTKRGGFKRLDEILAIQGIGIGLYNKLAPYVVL